MLSSSKPCPNKKSLTWISDGCSSLLELVASSDLTNKDEAKALTLATVDEKEVPFLTAFMNNSDGGLQSSTCQSTLS